MRVPTNRCQVLIIDDDPSILTLARSTAEAEFDVRTAATSERARLELKERPADIVVCDQHLPGQNGVDFLDWLRRGWPATVRILMTSHAHLEDLIEAVNGGQIRRFLLKPWRPVHLLGILREESQQLFLERSHESLLDQYRRLNQELEQRIQDRTRELEAAYRQLQQRTLILQRMALTDPLTGLPNRRGMDQLIRNELVRRTRSPFPFALAMLDVDHFKDINTQYLLSGGDHVLAWLGRMLADTVRTVDTIGRVGGEEFMLVAPETDAEGARVLAERVRLAIEQAGTAFNGHEIRVTISIGMIAVEEKDHPDYESLRHEASAALSLAKDTGRNRCVFRRWDGKAEPV